MLAMCRTALAGCTPPCAANAHSAEAAVHQAIPDARRQHRVQQAQRACVAADRLECRRPAGEQRVLDPLGDGVRLQALAASGRATTAPIAPAPCRSAPGRPGDIASTAARSASRPCPRSRSRSSPGSMHVTQIPHGRSSRRSEALIRWIAPFEPQ